MAWWVVLWRRYRIQQHQRPAKQAEAHLAWDVEYEDGVFSQRLDESECRDGEYAPVGAWVLVE